MPVQRHSCWNVHQKRQSLPRVQDDEEKGASRGLRPGHSLKIRRMPFRTTRVRTQSANMRVTAKQRGCDRETRVQMSASLSSRNRIFEEEYHFMCGIVGFIGTEEAAPILLEGLSRLEYRGYDSAGLAVYDQKKGLQIVKAKGRLQVLYDLTDGGTLIPGAMGVGHTRWATHGAPNDVNSHPQVSQSGRIAVVHNGIIENYAKLKEFLESKGVTFASETDTEVVAQLLEYYYDGDLLDAVSKVLHRIEGAYALGIVCADEPDKLVAVRKDSPLVLGYGEGFNLLASDVTAVIKHTREVCYLDDGEVAVLTPGTVQVYNSLLQPVEKERSHVDWEISAAEKGGYEHFMFKEIMEQPKALRDTIFPRLRGDRVVLEDLTITREDLERMDRLYIIACGSSYHVGVTAKYILERLLRIPVEVTLASEFRYCDPIVTDRTLALVISQSGETIDTLAAMREAKRLGARLLSIVNVVGSTIARESDERAVHLGGAGDRRGHHQGLLHPAGGDLSGGPLLCRSAGPDRSAGVPGAGGPAAPAPLQGGGDPRPHPGDPVLRLHLLQPRFRLFHRTEYRLRRGTGGFPQAEGDLLHPLGGIRRR